MDALVEDLNAKLQQWNPDLADRVRQTVSEIIEMANSDGLDILPARTVEQDVLNSLQLGYFLLLRLSMNFTQ